MCKHEKRCFEQSSTRQAPGPANLLKTRLQGQFEAFIRSFEPKEQEPMHPLVFVELADLTRERW